MNQGVDDAEEQQARLVFIRGARMAAQTHAPDQLSRA